MTLGSPYLRALERLSIAFAAAVWLAIVVQALREGTMTSHGPPEPGSSARSLVY